VKALKNSYVILFAVKKTEPAWSCYFPPMFWELADD
jgi:hypothetical protein